MGRPRETWRRSVERDMKEKRWSWGQVVKLSKYRQHAMAFPRNSLMCGHERRGLSKYVFHISIIVQVIIEMRAL